MNAKEFVSFILNMAKENGLNVFVVTDGASGISNVGNPAVKNAREAHIKWEQQYGFDPDEDWADKVMPSVEDIEDNRTEYIKGMQDYVNQLKTLPKDKLYETSKRSLINSEIIDEDGKFTEQFRYSDPTYRDNT